MPFYKSYSYESVTSQSPVVNQDSFTKLRPKSLRDEYQNFNQLIKQPASSSFLNSSVKVWITLSHFKVFPWYVQHFAILPHPPHPPPAYRCSLRVMSLPVSSDVTQAITSWCGTHPFHGWTWRNLSWNINGQKKFIKSILSWLVSYCLSLTFYFFKSSRFLFRSIGPVGFFSHGVVGEPIH